MLLTAVCVAACAVLVFAEYAKLRTVRVVSKLLASAAFVALGMMAFEIVRDPARVQYGQLIFIGLVFGAIGDAALLGKSSGAFLGGLGSFLLGHIAYIIAFAYLVPPSGWLTGAGGYAAIPIVAGLGVLALLWPKLGSMRVPVIAYVLAIVTMVVAAIAAWRTDALPDPQRTRMLIGALLFFVSDLAVARDKFVKATFSNKSWGLPAYYAAQLFIAWSLAGL
jgi:uncharacterized membrane protein YhhN